MRTLHDGSSTVTGNTSYTVRMYLQFSKANGSHQVPTELVRVQDCAPSSRGLPKPVLKKAYRITAYDFWPLYVKASEASE